MRARLREKAGNLTGGIPGSREEGVLNSARRSESVLYDFAEDGGAVGTITFGRVIPAGAIIKSITLDIQTAVTDAGSGTTVVKAGATILTAATDITALSGIAIIALTDTDGIKVSVASELKITLAVAAITAGKVRFFVDYLMPND